jgi:hypothetical protein
MVEGFFGVRGIMIFYSLRLIWFWFIWFFGTLIWYCAKKCPFFVLKYLFRVDLLKKELDNGG